MIGLIRWPRKRRAKAHAPAPRKVIARMKRRALAIRAWHRRRLAKLDKAIAQLEAAEAKAARP